MVYTMFLVMSMLSCFAPLYGQWSVVTQKLADNTYQVHLERALAPDEVVYHEYMQCSTNHPNIGLVKWCCSEQPISHYDPTFKETKKGYRSRVGVTAQVHAPNKKALQQSEVTIAYYSSKQGKMVQEIIKLAHPQHEKHLETSIDTTPVVTTTCPRTESSDIPDTTGSRSLTDYISGLIKSTQSLTIRLLLVFLLGMLMSLTPCIYPMIPITVGILQAQGSSSFWYNALLSLSYTMGIALTFASLGLAAAATGSCFGSILAQPLFIIVLVALLAYLAFSMLGLYDMYIPSFFRPGNHMVKGGSILSAFMLGAASGTIASPCLSPGLVLLLSIVTTMASKWLGFMLLFSFGVGLSVPLLIIGSFSGSLNMLPRAGMWMVEIKKLFGFLLLAVCFYFLNTLLPLYLTLWIVTAILFLTGIYYIYQVKDHAQQPTWKFIKNILGLALIAASVFTGFKAFQFTTLPAECLHLGDWNYSLKEGLATALAQEKNVIVDIGAPYCSLCSAIDRTLFANQQVLKAFSEFVLIKIDGSDGSDQSTFLASAYKVFGFPTILIINPKTNELLARFGGELYDMKPETFIVLLSKLVKR